MTVKDIGILYTEANRLAVIEFSYRHTSRNRDMLICIENTIDGMIGRRLSYEELTS
jgi:hypothetical protein